MKRILIGVVSCYMMLSGCGSVGQDNSSPNLPTPITLRKDLVYAYYGSNPTQLSETKEHVNYHMAARWYGPAEQEKQIMESQAAGIWTILDMAEAYEPDIADLVEVRSRIVARFERLKQLDILQNVRVIYPIDEPEIHGYTDAQVSAINGILKSALTEYHMDTKLFVIYSDKRIYPGIGSYDIVAFDKYGEGDRIISNGDLQRFLANVSSYQSIALIPGGAEPWKTDPTQFFNYAQGNLKVCCIIPFLWIDKAADRVGLGIRSNGLVRSYVDIGYKIKSNNP